VLAAKALPPPINSSRLEGFTVASQFSFLTGRANCN